MSKGAKTPEEYRLEELLNLEAALRLSGQEVPAKLTADISSLSSHAPEQQQGSEQDRDRQKQRIEAQVTALVSHGISREHALNHVHFAENGFSESGDIYQFGGMLDDRKYREFLLGDSPESIQEREKIQSKAAEYYAAKIESGEMTLEEAEKEFTNAPKTAESKAAAAEVFGGVREKLREMGIGSEQSQSNSVKDITDPVSNLVSGEKLQDLQAKSEKAEEQATKIEQTGDESAIEEYQVSKEEKREAAKEIRQEVYANAEKNGVRTIQHELLESEAEDLAALFDEPENKVAANTLKNTQNQSKSEPTSTPNEVELVANTKAAEQASSQTGLS